MSEPRPPLERERAARRRPPARRGRLRIGRIVALAVLAAVVFVLGIALGAAVESNRSPGGSRTFVRTFAPLPQAPVPRTVTVTAP